MGYDDTTGDAPVLLGGRGSVPKPWLVGLSRRNGWRRAHTITVAGGALAAAGIGAFWTTPLDDVPEVAKYLHTRRCCYSWQS